MRALATEDRARSRVLALVRRGAREVPLVVVAILLVSTAADILPNDNLFGAGEVRFNLARLLILIGLLIATGGLVQLREMTVITGLSMAGSGIMGQAVGDTLYITDTTNNVTESILGTFSRCFVDSGLGLCP